MTRNTQVYRTLYFYLLLLLAGTLPLSIFATSVIQFMLALNWFLEGDLKAKWKRIRTDRAFLVYSGFYLVHLLGMAWSADFHYGIQDLKIKLPLIVIPFIVVSSESLSAGQIRKILAVFIAGTIIASLASVLALVNIIPVDKGDFRNVSLFISHIRFALMVVLSIMFCFYLLFNRDNDEPGYFRLFYGIALVWLPVFLVLLKSLSGIIILMALAFYLSLQLARKFPDRAGRFMLTIFVLFIPLFAIYYIGNSIKRFYTVELVDLTALDSLTVEGNPYKHQVDNREIENGNYVWLYVCPEELEREWNRISDYDYMGKADNGDHIRFTIIRYLSSKGFRKDAAGLRQLTKEDIQAIETGIANHIYLNRFKLYPRIYEVIWEFDRFGLGYNPNDKSLIQRYFYIRAGASIAKKNLLFGVGTGDVRKSFEKYYDEIDSPLRIERRRRAHNQFLTFTIALGIPGMVLCLLAFIYPVFLKNRWRSYMVIVFLLTVALSMLDEDTLENTPGAVMFGLFYSLFVFGPNWEWRKKDPAGS